METEKLKAKNNFIEVILLLILCSVSIFAGYVIGKDNRIIPPTPQSQIVKILLPDNKSSIDFSISGIDTTFITIKGKDEPRISFK